MKHLLLLFSVMILTAFTTSCTTRTDIQEKEEHTNAHIMIVHSEPGMSLQPFAGPLLVQAGIAETLVRVDDDLRLQPWLAERWEHPDVKTWVFTLREGVKFHDGSPLDAQAVKASLEQAVRSSSGLAHALRIQSIKAEGQQLILHTEEQSPALPAELVDPRTCIAKIVKDRPIGTGPFRLDEFHPGDYLHVLRHDDYWDGRPQLKSATIRFLQDPEARVAALNSGLADVAYDLPPSSATILSKQSNFRVEVVPGLRVQALLYNPGTPLLQNVQVRQAFDRLIDRDRLVREIYDGYGIAANGPFTPTKFSFTDNEPPTAYDPKAAERLFRAAGWQRRADGGWQQNDREVVLTLVTEKNRADLHSTAELLQTEWAKFGIQLHWKWVTNLDQYLREADDWDIALTSQLTALTGDGWSYLNAAYAPQGRLNPVHWRVPEITSILTLFELTAHPASRDNLAREIVSQLRSQVPRSYLVHPHLLVGMKRNILNWAPGSEECYLLTPDITIRP
jgi:peptide/nickel transport system substrate-binding protein